MTVKKMLYEIALTVMRSRQRRLCPPTRDWVDLDTLSDGAVEVLRSVATDGRLFEEDIIEALERGIVRWETKIQHWAAAIEAVYAEPSL